ncbi:hypothetical protein LIER_04455 [Lithospermum erythrorhizon]|uniref:Retrotransposon gag domain-containing protein n=1 Tax=Lithospermum erythrorhizon TaxID=34254 RepID=A0AAV3NWR7_LITER
MNTTGAASMGSGADCTRSRKIKPCRESHHIYSHYIDNEESYSDMEARATTHVAPIPNQTKHVQVPVVHGDPIVAAMQQQLDTLKKFIATAFPASITPVAPTTKMPFSDRLDAFQLPLGFKLPQLELYDSTGDPIKYLQGYIAHMTITSNNLDVYAKAFPNSLTGKAKDWYMALPLKTIDPYQQTTDAFVAKFATDVQRRQDGRILMDIQQGKNKPL